MTALQVFVDLDLTPTPPNGSGLAYLTPSTQVTDPTDGITLITLPSGYPFTGVPLTVQVYATDNPNMAPSGWAWQLTFSQNPQTPGNPLNINFFAPAGPLSYTATNASPGVVTPTYTAAFTTAFPTGTAQRHGGSVPRPGHPRGFSNGTTYYIVNGGRATTFQLSATRGGAAINSSSTGSGTAHGYQVHVLGPGPPGDLPCHLALPHRSREPGKPDERRDGADETSGWEVRQP